MARICLLAPNAIDLFISQMERDATGLCRESYELLESARSLVSNAWNMYASQAASSLADCRSRAEALKRVCHDKYEDIHRLSIPKDIPKVVTEKKTERDAQGNAVTIEVEKIVSEHNPEYDRRQRLLQELEKKKTALDYVLADCSEHESQLRAMQEHINQYLEQITVISEGIDEICRLTTEHFKELAKAADNARWSLKRAMSSIGFLPAVNKDEGTVNIDGVREYVNRLNVALDDCGTALSSLTRASNDVSANWNDSVYTYFNNVIQDDLVSSLDSVTNTLEEVRSALNTMCEYLEDYYDASFDYRRGEVFVTVSTYSLEYGATMNFRQFRFTI